MARALTCLCLHLAYTGVPWGCNSRVGVGASAQVDFENSRRKSFYPTRNHHPEKEGGPASRPAKKYFSLGVFRGFRIKATGVPCELVPAVGGLDMDNAYRKAVEAAQDKRDNDAWESHLAGLAEPWDMEEAPEAEDE